MAANQKRRLSIDFPTEGAMLDFFVEAVQPWTEDQCGRRVSIFQRDALDSKAITPKYEYIVKAPFDRPYGEFKVISARTMEKKAE